MPHLTEDTTLWSAWFAAACDPAIDTALRACYADLDAEVASRNPTCWLSGKCCKFDTHGHKLYVTALEIAWVISRLDPLGRSRLYEAPLPDLDGCPFQVNGLCSVHALRPLGCRVYFCDPSAQGWQNDLYETFLSRLRRLHEERGVEYRYMEWRLGLSEARAALSI